jgi:hypothetical protein
MERLGVCLVAVALIVGVTGCGPAPLQHALTISSSVGGNAITPGEGTFTIDYGTVVGLVAEPDDNFHFVQWTGDVGTVADAGAAFTTITIEGDYTITAQFGIDLQELIEYELTISSTAGGSVTVPGEGVLEYEEETVVDLVAVADDYYEFVEWTGDVEDIDDPLSATTTITMNDDYSVTANFERIEYDLIISSTSGGSVTDPGEGTYLHDAGTVVDLVAVADDCYEFIGWTGDVEDIDDLLSATTTITMNDDYSVTANFERIEYDLVISSTSGGSVTEPGENTFTYDCGTVVDLVAAADDYYEFVGWTGDVEDIDDPLSATTTITMNDHCSITVSFEFKVDPMIAAGGYHTVGLMSSGTVVAAGSNASGQCDVDDWEDIIQVTAGVYHTVGLRDDGTVIGAGSNASGQCDVDDWEDIIQVAAGVHHTVGIKDDGTVVAVGDNDHGQCNVSGWTDIVQVAAGGFHTVGVKNDGTVVAMGLNTYGQCNVGNWEDITQVAASESHTVGLKDDGTVVGVGWDLLGQCNVGDWTDIVQVAAGVLHTVGLKDDGTVVAVGWNAYGQLDVDGWTDIVQVTAGEAHTVGLRDDGTVVAVGDNDHYQCDVDDWNLN